MKLQKGLKAKWALKGGFNLIDIRFEFFILKFECLEFRITSM